MDENQKFDESEALCLKNNFQFVLIPKASLKHGFKTNFEFYAPPPGGRHPGMAPTQIMKIHSKTWKMHVNVRRTSTLIFLWI